MSVFKSLPISPTHAEVNGKWKCLFYSVQIAGIPCQFFKKTFSFSLGYNPGLLPESLRPSSFAQASLFARMGVKNGCVRDSAPAGSMLSLLLLEKLKPSSLRGAILSIHQLYFCTGVKTNTKDKLLFH